MKSYYDIHEIAYQQIKKNNHFGWGNAKTIDELSDPLTLKYLKSSVEKFFPNPNEKKALDLGCGTGPTAFLLSQLGFDVTGVDVSQTAIEMAKDLATRLNLNINFQVQDLLSPKNFNQKFDLIYDSHCLHCLVFDEDRKLAYQQIQALMNGQALFIFDTMTMAPDCFTKLDKTNFRFDENYILWHKTNDSSIRGVVTHNGELWCAQRRIYPKEKIIDEITENGFLIESETLDLQEKGEPGMLRLVLSSQLSR